MTLWREKTADDLSSYEPLTPDQPLYSIIAGREEALEEMLFPILCPQQVASASVAPAHVFYLKKSVLTDISPKEEFVSGV